MPLDRRERLIRSGLTLASELDLELVLDRIVREAVDLTDATYGALGVLGPDGRISSFITVGVTQEQRAKIGDPPTGHGILGLLIEEARAVRIRNISEHPISYGFPPNHPEMTSFLGAPVASRGTVYGNIYLTNKRGAEEFSPQDEEALVILAQQAGIAVQNARLYDEATTRQRWLEAAREIATKTLSRGEPEETLQLITTRARELVGAALSWLVVPEAGGRLRVSCTDGDRAAEILGMELPMDRSLSGEVVRLGTYVEVPDARSDERAFAPLVETADVGPALYVPLTSHGRAFGTLAVANHPGGATFDPERIRLIETFADQAALVLEYARAQREVERLVVLEDRERIAKELHDGVIQALFAVGMGLQGAALMSPDQEIAERIEGSVAEIDRVIRDLRNYIFGLRPGILADRELDTALRALVEEFASKTGVVAVAEIDADTAAELSHVAGDVLQLAREALSNVGRHAEATTCRMSLYRTDIGAILEIDDDGRGFDPDNVRRGDGLTNVEERTSALGGKVSYESAPAQGTTVRVELPL